MPIRAFLSADVKKLLKNKFVVIIGGSVQRSAYKDLVQLLHSSSLVLQEQLKKKGELSFLDDKLIEGGSLKELHNGISYMEEREYKTDLYCVRFYFVTRCYNEYVESILKKLTKKEEPAPDVIVMNSCVWDITRYGPNSIEQYHKNLIRLFNRFDEVLSKDTLVVWTTQLPVDQKARGGFMLPEVDFLSYNLHRAILEGNFYARQVAADHGYDLLDLYYFLKNMTHHQVKDGIHWNPIAHRRISNLILTHIAEAWGCRLPARVLPFMDPRSHVYGIEHPDWNITDGNSHCPDLPPDFQHQYQGPINRSNYSGPPRNHHRSVSVDPQYLEGPSYNILSDIHSPRCGPIMGHRSRHGGSMNCRSYVDMPEDPDWSITNGGSHHRDLPPNFQHRHHGPINRSNYSGPPRNHHRSFSVDPQYLEGSRHNTPSDIHNPHGSPIKRPNYTRPQSCHGGPMNCHIQVGMPRNHHRSVSAGGQYFCIDLQNHRGDENIWQEAIEVLDEWTRDGWRDHPQNTFRVPAVPHKHISYPCARVNFRQDEIIDHSKENYGVPRTINHEKKRLRILSPTKHPEKKFRGSFPVNYPSNMGPCHKHLRSIRMDLQNIRRPGVLQPYNQNNMDW